MSLVEHVHSSGRFDRPLRAVLSALQEYSEFANIITLTEQHQNDRDKLRLDGWQTVKYNGPGDGDPAVLVKSSDWQVIRKWRKQLTQHEQRRGPGGPPPPHSLTVLLRHRRTQKFVLVTVAHLPSNVQGDFRDGAYRVMVWNSAVAGWKRHVKEVQKYCPGAKVMYVADWNLDVKKSWVRVVLRTKFPRLALTWRKKFPGPGTHHARIIDATLTDLSIVRKARLVEDDNMSDHRPYLEILDW